MAINKNKVMDAGRKAYEKGQYDKAIKEYSKVVKEDPKDVRVWLKIGDLYAKKNSKTEATDTYQKVATFYSEQGFFLKAVAVYKQILKVDPRLAEVNLKLAELYRQLGLLSEAMQHFEMVAAFFHREGKNQEALATLRQLVELDPENVATRIKLAELYSKEGMTQEAIKEFTITCEFLRNSGRKDDFVKVAERLVYHDPKNIDLCKELAVFYLKRNDPRRALAKLQICFKADQSDPNILALLAQAFQRLDQRGKTVSVLKELARVHVEAGKKREAAEVHEKILIYVPSDPDSLEFLGRTKGAAPPVPSSRSQVPVEVPQSRSVNMNMPASGSGRARTGGSSASSAAMNQALELDSQGTYQHAEQSVETQESADEIVKILTETDVYVKYGLHEKAIGHLRRVFKLDERNVEARERLQEVLLKEDRQGEALQELLILAEHTVGKNPEQAMGYLDQILSMDESNQKVRAFAAKHRLNLGLPSDDYLSDEDSITPLDDALLLELSDDDLEEVDIDDLIEISPDTNVESLGNDFQERSTGGTIDIDVDEAGDMTLQSGEVDLSFDTEGSLGPLAEPIEPLSPPAPADDLAFDAADAAAFDSEKGFSSQESSDMDLANLDLMRLSPGSDDVSSVEVDSSQYLISDMEIASEQGLAGDSLPLGSSLEDGLEQVENHISQGLPDKARGLLESLRTSFPNHPLILSKFEELDSTQAFDPETMEEAEVDYDDSLLGNFDDVLLGDSAVDSLGADELIIEDSSPAVVLENPIADDDAATHFDLGQAYKEMGIYSEAIAAFEKIMNFPGREVQCRLMIGLCHREQGSLSEAISQFKAGLYANEISESEKFGLYYEIGTTYKDLKDPQEALYYYEMILKKDASYRDVQSIVDTIKSE